VYLILSYVSTQITVEVFALLGCYAELIVVPDVSGQLIGTMFKGQEDCAERLYGNASN
jgi:hypothetical protein